MKIIIFLLWILWISLLLIVFWQWPKQQNHLVALKTRIEVLEADNYKLSQNDSTLAAVINQLYRKIKALEADTVKGKQ